jgi:hypothetical protein
MIVPKKFCRIGNLVCSQSCDSIGLIELWQDLLIRHCIDIMHVEKNVCENIIQTICGEKDNKEVKQDLETQNILPHLWLN